MNSTHLWISLAMLFIAIIIMISNRAISDYRLRKYYTDTKQGSPTKYLPFWIVILSVTGFTILISSIIFAFTIKWWLGLLIIVAWVLMFFYKPELARIKEIYENGNAKRCEVCKKFYDYGHFEKMKSNIDGLDNKCKTCKGKVNKINYGTKQ